MPNDIMVPNMNSRLKAAVRLAAWALAVYGLYFVARLISRNASSLSVCEQLPYVRLGLISLGAFLAALVFIAAKSGLAVWNSEQSPAPNAWLLFSQRIRLGWSARLDAIIMFAASAFLATILIGLAKYFVFSEAGLYIVGIRACLA